MSYGPGNLTERYSVREAVHELRNLFAVIASARNLLNDDQSSDYQALLLEAIGKAALRGGGLATDLLAGRPRNHDRLIDINHRLAALKPMLLALAGSDVAIRFQLCPGDAPLRCDPDALDAAIIELVRNARRACGAGGTIRLRTRRGRGSLRLMVADDGYGMSREGIRRLLTHAAPATAHGSGIGHVRALAAKLHGKVRIRSREGFGTVVSLNLPTDRSVAADELPARVVRTSPQARNVIMKTDSQLQRDVMAELEFEPSVDQADIGVAVTDGVVTLSGFVKSYAEKIAAERAVRRVAGVRAIAEEIKVRLASAPKTGDAEIAKRISDMIDWDITIPSDKIKVKVEHGWVTLSGKVDWHFQSDNARRAAGKVSGVLGVSDLIEVRRQPAASDVKDRIVAAIKRSADADAAAITVVSDGGGKVKLGGHVKGWHERDVAERAAWGVPGVTKVEDNIVIAA